MTDLDMAVNWIRSQGWSEENLPSDELLQMEQSYLAGLKAGAEPREKRIVELEKSIQKKKFIIDQLNVQLAEFEKENAELKDDNKVMVDNYYKMEQKFYDKLTEAKEILKKYLSIGVGGKITQNYLDVTKQAEQFLKESENK